MRAKNERCAQMSIANVGISAFLHLYDYTAEYLNYVLERTAADAVAGE